MISIIEETKKKKIVQLSVLYCLITKRDMYNVSQIKWYQYIKRGTVMIWDEIDSKKTLSTLLSKDKTPPRSFTFLQHSVTHGNFNHTSIVLPWHNNPIDSRVWFSTPSTTKPKDLVFPDTVFVTLFCLGNSDSQHCWPAPSQTGSYKRNDSQIYGWTTFSANGCLSLDVQLISRVNVQHWSNTPD